MARVRLERAERDAADERSRLYAIISGLKQENAKLRELCKKLYDFAWFEQPHDTELYFAEDMKELRIGEKE